MLKKFRKGKKQANKPEAIPKSAMPKITNETVEQHREEVLSSARKYIYPLQHSKHKIVIVTTTLIIITVILFFGYCTLALYRLQSTSTFLYRVSQIIPFPIARQGSRFIAYENYLFEIRRYKHFYERQQKLDFSTESGQEQLKEQKKRALEKVIDDAYVRDLAAQNGISVTDREVEDEIVLLRSQNRLGSSEDVLEDVLKEFYGWSRRDLKRTIEDQIMRRKLLAKLDTAATERANAALSALQSGKDFSKVAKEFSDDPSKEKDGEFGFLVDKTNADLPPQVTSALFALEAGQHSEIINTGSGLEIVKVLEKKDGRVEGAHIVINFKSLDEYINDAKENQPTRSYISLPSTTPVVQ